MELLDKIKLLARQIKKINDVDMHKIIVDMQAEAFILTEENKKLLEENSVLKEEAAQLKEKLRITSSIKFENSVYWLPDGKDGKDGPYCPNCWGEKQILMRMEQDITRNRLYNKCPDCMLVIRAK